MESTNDWSQREDVQAVFAHLDSPWGLEAFQRQVANANNCSHPVRLSGSALTYDAESGERIAWFDSGELPDGVLLKACGNRRASRCAPCAYVYKGDARHLVSAGLIGGKGVPESVSERTSLMVTLTGPGFGGALHTVGKSGPRPCRPGSPSRRCPHGLPVACFLRHQPDDPLVGEALCETCYPASHHVIWNALATELWRRTTIYTFRKLAQLAGITTKELSSVVRLEHLRVAEFQERGVVHLHAIVRADGADGQGSPPPSWLSADLLSMAIRQAVQEVSVPFPVKLGGRITPRARWGKMLDISVISDSDGSKRASRYCAKYLGKSTDAGGVLDHRLHVGEIPHLREKGLSAHQCRLVETAWRLGGRPELAHLHLRYWAHQLGYRGHCIAKSRRYSTTLGALRQARAEHVARRARGDNAPAEVIKLASWQWQGSGYKTKGDALLARQWADAAAEARFFYWLEYDTQMSEIARSGWPDVG